MNSNFLLYGANGYTGRLILDRAIGEGARPILGGRNAGTVRSLAKEHGLDARVFDVSDESAAMTALTDVPAVLNAAGPFHRTALPMVRACLQTHTHYLDVTGEIGVFESLAELGDAARHAHTMVLPGVGFDVVPTDCLAAHLKSRLPDATELVLAFKGLGGVSRGSATTAVETMLCEGAVRRDGRIERVPVAWKTRSIDFGDGLESAVTIPWGDVSTAYHSTGIGNVEVYMGLPSAMIWQMQMARYVNWILRLPLLQESVKALINAGAPGPSARTRAATQAVVWGQVRNRAGRRVSARLHTPNGYALTAMTALRAARNAVGGEIKPGFQTPSCAFGKDFILQFDGVRREDIAS